MIVLYITEKFFLLLLFRSFQCRRNIKDWFKINGRQRIIMPKKVKTLNVEFIKET